MSYDSMYSVFNIWIDNWDNLFNNSTELYPNFPKSKCDMVKIHKEIAIWANLMLEKDKIMLQNTKDYIDCLPCILTYCAIFQKGNKNHMT